MPFLSFVAAPTSWDIAATTILTQGVSPGKQSLLPKVLIYDADIPKDEAIVMDLAESPGITIESALKPEDISEDAFKWFNPREKLSYYFTAESSN